MEEFFCASTYLRVNTFFVYSQLTLHTDRARTLHTLSNHSEVTELCALCQTLDTSAFTQLLEYVHPDLSNQDVNAFHESFNETNNKGLSVVRLFLPSRSLEPSRQVACGGEIRWNLTC